MPLVIVSVVVAHVLCARHRRAAEAIDAQVFAEHPAAVSGLGEHPVSGPLLLPRWEQLVLERPVLVATMGRSLSQIGCTLRPDSVKGSDLALRWFAALVRCVGSPRSSPRSHPRCSPSRRSVVATSRTTNRGWRCGRDQKCCG
jgi:hypothetical protein